MVTRTLMNVILRVQCLSRLLSPPFLFNPRLLGCSFNFSFLQTSISSLFLVLSCCLPVTLDSLCENRTDQNRAEQNGTICWQQAAGSSAPPGRAVLRHCCSRMPYMALCSPTPADSGKRSARPKRSQQCDVELRHVAKL